ncbi:hypothetical protein [Peterkaempfera sp. SMS 1(5)a]|uniref:hypothetical protein n=1 Tax=Peterkaempfera podocarpi TaxID=3232308 RepID=UPI00366B55C9
MDNAAEDAGAEEPAVFELVHGDRLMVSARRQLVAVRWGLVVVPLVDGQDVSDVGLVQDRDVVEDPAPDAADHPLAVPFIRGTCDACEDLHLLGPHAALKD